MTDGLTPEQRQARDNLHQAITEAGHAGLGPASFKGFLSEWVIVANWIDPDSGETISIETSSENLVRTHRIGLLHAALYDNDWDGER